MNIGESYQGFKKLKDFPLGAEVSNIDMKFVRAGGTAAVILTKGEELLKEDKGNLALINLLTGRTKEGIFGNEFYDVNKKLVDLSEPLISEDDKKIVNTYYSESIDPDGRGHKNIIKMMMKDGLFKYLPKNDDSWVKFLTPFLKLTRKEKTKFKTKN